jgi:hypothetical protein
MGSFLGCRCCGTLGYSPSSSADSSLSGASETQFRSIKKESRNSLRQGLMMAHGALRPSFMSGASIRAATVADLDAQTTYHVSNKGDLLVSYSEIHESGLEFAVVLNGDVGLIPVQMSLRGRLDVDHKKVEIGLKLLKPFETQEYLWNFSLEGLRSLGAGGFFASDVRMETSEVMTATIDKWCVYRCGGLAILGVLVTCLPSLAGGPAAYVACIVAEAGSGAAGIAACVAEKCI